MWIETVGRQPGASFFASPQVPHIRAYLPIEKVGVTRKNCLVISGYLTSKIRICLEIGITWTVYFRSDFETWVAGPS